MVPSLRSTLFLLLLFGLSPVFSFAQSDLRTRNPVGLFQDMQADTVTSDLFNHFAPTPHMKFQVTNPIPGQEFAIDVHSMAALDFDNDGDMDFATGGYALDNEPGGLLWLNDGQGKFSIAEDSGLPRRLAKVVAGDLDNDGFTDLIGIVIEGGIGRWQKWENHDVVKEAWAQADPLKVSLVWFRNRAGHSFSSIPLTHHVLNENFGKIRHLMLDDFNLDGWLDLLVVLMTHDTPPVFHTFLGSPSGLQSHGFQEAETSAGVKSVSLFDMDEDGHQDLVVQSGAVWKLETGSLQWWSFQSGRWVEREKNQFPPRSTHLGIIPMDINNDGRWDLFRGASDAQGGTNQMLVNKGPGVYEDRGKEMGLWAGYNITTGCLTGDWDNDTYLDLIQLREFNETRFTESVIYLNEAGQRFLNINQRVDKPLGPSTRTGVPLDVDQDGDLDIILGYTTAFLENVPLADVVLQLVRNESHCGNWLKVKLVGVNSNRSALGAEAAVHCQGKTIHRRVAGSVIWGACQPPLTMHFGLGNAAEVDSITVTWPGGKQEIFPGVGANQAIVLKESQGARP